MALRDSAQDEPFLRRAAARLRAQCLDCPVSLLQAGSLAPLRELGLAELAEGGFEISVSVVDDDNPVARQALREAQSAYDDVITGDLRSARSRSGPTTWSTARCCSSG